MPNDNFNEKKNVFCEWNVQELKAPRLQYSLYIIVHI